MALPTPAVVVARKEGTLVSQNAPARRLMGPAVGKLCWDAVGGIEGAEGLPCQDQCVARLLGRGLERTQRTSLTLAGRAHHLTCVPVDGNVICVLNCGSDQQPDNWEQLTGREQDVLSLLAAGDETPAVATKLGVSESTVRTHVEKMRAKLGVRTRAALVALGFRFGYLS